MKKYKLKLFITGCLLSLLIGSMAGFFKCYKQNNTKVDMALVKDCYISNDKYVTVLDYNNYEYKTTDKNSYVKCINSKGEYIQIYVTTIKLSKLLMFDDKIIIKVK